MISLGSSGKLRKREPLIALGSQHWGCWGWGGGPYNLCVSAAPQRGTHQLVGVLGPGQVADLRAGVDALQGLGGQRVPEAHAAVGGAAPRGQQTVLVGRPGDGLDCRLVVRVGLHGAAVGQVPHKQLVVVAPGG